MSTESKRKHLFISHHSKDDSHITKLSKLLSSKGYDIRNSSIRVNERNQNRLNQKKVKKEVLERVLRMKISWASTVVVLIGKNTHQRPWVNWEIDKANEQGKRIVGVFVRGGTNADIPPSLEKYANAIVGWNTESIIGAIDGRNDFQNPDNSSRDPINGFNPSDC